MEDVYFSKLLDSKGVKLEFLLELLSDIVYGDLGANVKLAKALNNFDPRMETVEGVGQNCTLSFRRGDVIKLIKHGDGDEKWIGCLPQSVVKGKLQSKTGTFPSGLVREMSPKEWSCRDVIDFIIKPMTKDDNSVFSKTWHKKQKIAKSVKTKTAKIRHFLISSERDNFYEVIQSLVHHLRGRDVSKEYIFFDVVSVNHHLMEELILNPSKSAVFSSFLSSGLRRLIRQFDSVFVFMSKYDHPKALHSPYALWSIYQALQGRRKEGETFRDVEIEGILSKSERKRATRDIGKNYEDVVKLLPRVNIMNTFECRHCDLSDPRSLIMNRHLSDIIKTDKLSTDLNEEVKDRFLKIYFAHLSISVWHTLKETSEKSKSLELASLSNHVAVQLYKDLNWSHMARILLLYSAKRYSSVLGKHHIFTAAAFENLATVSFDMGIPTKALKVLKKSIEINIKHNSSSEYGDELSLLGNLYSDLNKPKLAEKVFHQMLMECNKHGKSNIFMAVGFNNLGEFLKSAGRLEESEIIFREALRVLRRNASNEKDDEVLRKESLLLMAQVYNNMGTMYELMGYGYVYKAFDGYRKSLELLRKVYKEDDLIIDQSVNNLATFLFVNSKFEEAEELIRSSIKIRVKNYGKSHGVVAQGLENLAAIMQSMSSERKQKDAIKPLLKACEIFSTTLGENHPRTLKCRRMIQNSIGM